jgi:hypothetical protein
MIYHIIIDGQKIHSFKPPKIKRPMLHAYRWCIDNGINPEKAQIVGERGSYKQNDGLPHR